MPVGSLFSSLGTLGGLTSAVGIAGSIKDLFAGPDKQQSDRFPPFRGTITTPAFTFGGGTLKRTGTDAFSAGGFANSLAGVRTGLTGLRSRVAGIRPAIATGLRGAQGLFGRGEALRSNIAGLDTTLAGLQGQVAPGFGRFTESAVQTIRNRASASAGNLRQSLAKRNVLGSSFANAQQATIERDFAELEEQTKAQAIVQEIDATRQIVKDRSGLVELSGRLLELDQRSLQEQARFIALDLQANEQEANLFTRQVQIIQTEMQAFRDQVNRELQELGISTAFLAIVDQIIRGNANSRVRQAANKIGRRRNRGDGGGGSAAPSPGFTGGLGRGLGSIGEGLADDTAAGDEGGDGGSGGDTDGGGGSCFAKGTLIQMQDGTAKPVEDVQIGDQTRGGRVTGVMAFAGDDDAYDYRGVTVSGSHAVFENGVWKRVEDSNQAIKVEAVEYWHVFNTTEHEIYVHDIRFSDYLEIEQRHPIERARDADVLSVRNELEAA
jgi:hypothetical protein